MRITISYYRRSKIMPPVISDGLYKDLLIHRAQCSARVLKSSGIPQLTTPLVTKFEKWSGKRRKLLFESEDQAISLGIKNFGLKNNVFAQLLASPMRSERNCKTKMPKDLLIQLKLKSSQVHDKPLELIPVVEHSKLNKNSYVVNSKSLLSQQIKAFGRWIPMAALISQMRFFQMQDVSIDKSKFLTDYEEALCQQLRDKLIEASNVKSELQEGDAIVCFNRDNNKGIEIRTNKLEPHKNSYIVVFNLRCNNPSFEQLINENKNHDEGIVIGCSKNASAFKLLYKILAYHCTR